MRPRKQILTLRSLMLRERATTADAVLKFVFGLPNGPAWNVLSFWQCHYSISMPKINYSGPDDIHWHAGPW